MSNNLLRYAPVDPWFQPTAAASSQARTLLSSFLPQSEEVVATSFAGIQFIDPCARRAPLVLEVEPGLRRMASVADHLRRFLHLPRTCAATASLDLLY